MCVVSRTPSLTTIVLVIILLIFRILGTAHYKMYTIKSINIIKLFQS